MIKATFPLRLHFQDHNRPLGKISPIHNSPVTQVVAVAHSHPLAIPRTIKVTTSDCVIVSPDAKMIQVPTLACMIHGSGAALSVDTAMRTILARSLRIQD
jgi:hypothetical protein